MALIFVVAQSVQRRDDATATNYADEKPRTTRNVRQTASVRHNIFISADCARVHENELLQYIPVVRGILRVCICLSRNNRLLIQPCSQHES